MEQQWYCTDCDAGGSDDFAHSHIVMFQIHNGDGDCDPEHFYSWPKQALLTMVADVDPRHGPEGLKHLSDRCFTVMKQAGAVVIHEAVLEPNYDRAVGW